MPENQPTATTTEKSSSRLRLKAGAMLAATALALTAELKPALAEEQAPVVEKPGFIIGAMEDSVLSTNIEESREFAKKISEAGFNTLKVSMPWTHPRQCAEIDNDLARFQNAATSARESGLFFMLNLIPGGGNGLGMAPVTPSQRRCYKDTLISYLHAFEEVNPKGHLVLEVPNEPNSDTFWRPQKDKENEWVAPKSVTRLLSGIYQPVKDEASQLGVKVTIVGGGLASKNRPQQFVEQMGIAKKDLGKSGRLMDVFSHHPYPLVNDEAPDAKHQEGGGIGFGDLDRLAATLDTSLAPGLTIWSSESGRKTRVPRDKLGMYKVAPNTQSNLVTESQQAEYYSREIKMARCHPRVGAIVLFNVIDDSDGLWTSGIMYPDGSPKSSYEQVKLAISDAKSTNPDC